MAKKINVDVNLRDEEAKKKLKDIENGKYKVDVDINSDGADKTTKKISELAYTTKHSQTVFTMSWITEVLRSNPSIAIFLTIGVGFWIGRLKFKGFSLGLVTSVLLVGVLVGQLNIPIPGPIKQVFFLLFLFAIGYSVGPQFSVR